MRKSTIKRSGRSPAGKRTPHRRCKSTNGEAGEEAEEMDEETERSPSKTYSRRLAKKKDIDSRTPEQIRAAAANRKQIREAKRKQEEKRSEAVALEKKN